VSAFRLDNQNGHLAPIGTFPIQGPEEPCLSTPLAISPDKRFLFVALRNQPWSVRSFAIEPTSGHLQYVGGGPLADNTCYISTDRSGRFLLSASYTGNKIAVNPIGADGIVRPAQQIIDTSPKPHSILVDAANRYALSACNGADIFYQWHFDDRMGRLTPNHPSYVSVDKDSGPRHFVFHPNGRAVYLLNEHTVSIYAYAYDSGTGLLTEKQIVSGFPANPASKVWATDIHITPDGMFLYAAERGSSELVMFRVDPQEGTLARIGSTITERQPRGFAIDPSGRFLYCAGQLSDRISGYAIDSRMGILTKFADYPVGKNPNWVEIVHLS